MTTWLDTLTLHRLPVLQATCTRVEEFRRMPSDQFNLADLSNVVLADPLMAFQVLRSTGRIERTRTFSESLNIEHALMILGANAFFEEFAKLTALESIPTLSQTGVDQHDVPLTGGRLADQGLAVADGRTPGGRLLCGRPVAQCASLLLPRRIRRGQELPVAGRDGPAGGFSRLQADDRTLYRKPAPV
jgi:hypothetical protein